VGSGEGLCPPQLGVWGLAPRKKINIALKLCNSEQVLVLLSYITAESGGIIPPVLKVGGPIPSSLLRRLCTHRSASLNGRKWQGEVRKKAATFENPDLV